MTVATPVKTEVNPEVKTEAKFEPIKPDRLAIRPATSKIGAPAPNN